MIAYKVLRNVYGRLYSAVDRRDDTVIEYSRTEPIKPSIGEAFVFRKLKDARRFGLVRATEVWKVKCSKLTFVVEVALDESTFDLVERFRLYWASECPEDDTMTAPEGTYTTPELELLTKVA